MSIRKYSRQASIPGFVLVLSAFCPASDDASDKDPLLRALVDEVQRSMTLKLEGLEPPYFVQYVVNDTIEYRIGATYGGISSSDTNRSRGVRTEVRTGSYELDNTNFSGGGGGFGGRMGGGGGRIGLGGSLPLDDDYLAIRHALWLATDSTYKSAVETLTQKRAYLASLDEQERPPDFAKSEPVLAVEPKVTIALDAAVWQDRLRRLSAVLLEQKEILDGSVQLAASAENRYLVNSEGSRLRTGETRAVLTISAEAQAEDGERLSDRLVYTASSPESLPGLEAMLEDTRTLVARLAAGAKASLLEDYVGPVLFDSRAAPRMFQQLLAGGLAARRDETGGGRRRAAATENLDKYLGRRILPRSFQVVDDPRAASFGSRFLSGHYLYDAEGVAAQQVELVVDGVLRDLLTSRVPTRAFKTSNGHGRGAGRAGIGCLYITAKEGLPQDKMKEALLQAAKEQGLEYAIRVTALSPGRGGIAERFASMFGGRSPGRRGAGGADAGSAGGGGLSDPVGIFKVYVQDGHEEPVRGCEFGDVDVRTLMKILAAGAEPVVDNQEGGGGASILAPPVLFEELELYKIQGERERKPLTKPPHAR
ncbi:MAG: metallopeptidase TldD-related protein [Planctomycetota bacterium]